MKRSFEDLSDNDNENDARPRKRSRYPTIPTIDINGNIYTPTSSQLHQIQNILNNRDINNNNHNFFESNNSNTSNSSNSFNRYQTPSKQSQTSNVSSNTIQRSRSRSHVSNNNQINKSKSFYSKSLKPNPSKSNKSVTQTATLPYIVALRKLNQSNKQALSHRDVVVFAKSEGGLQVRVRAPEINGEYVRVDNNIEAVRKDMMKNSRLKMDSIIVDEKNKSKTKTWTLQEFKDKYLDEIVNARKRLKEFVC